MTAQLSEIAYKKSVIDSQKKWVVFLHDSLGCIELWKDFPEKFQEMTGLNVLIYDRQGYGQSPSFSCQQRGLGYMEIEAVILAQLLEHWKIEKPILFGHSDGGTIAMIYAGMFPDQVSGIITEGAHIFVEEITLEGINQVVHQYQTTQLKEKLAKYHASLTNDLFWSWADTWRSPTFKHWNCEAFLPKIICPSLLIQGEDDEFGSLLQVTKSLELIGENASSLILPNTKHSPHKEKPEEILNVVNEFIQDQVL